MMEDTDIKQNQPEGEETSCNRQEAEEARMGALVRMDYRRRHASQPDVDEAWNAFRQEKMVAKETPQRGFSAWHLTAAALLGAAAMLALVFVFRHSFFGEPTPQQPKEIVAMQYDEKPQRVKLEREHDTLDLTQKNSISYQKSDKPQKPAIVAQSQNKTQRLSTPRGMDFKVVLPDGSEVVLNAESTIEFPTAFQSGKRLVKLKGEAYFKVVRNDDAPFIVTSDQLSVRVLGTEFNMKSYASEVAHVALVKGKVEVMRPDATVCDATLNPGQEAWYNAKGEVQVQEVDTYAVTQWVSGFFYYHDQPLVKVLCDLGRWYNLGVVFQNTDALHYRVHFSALRNEPVDSALENLNRLRRIRVRLDGNKIVVY